MVEQAQGNQILNKWEQFLGKDKNHFLQIQNTATKLFAKSGNPKDPTYFFYADILSHPTILDWFKKLLVKENIAELEVSYHKRTGAKSIPAKGYQPEIFNVSNALAALKNSSMSTTPSNTPNNIEQPAAIPSPAASPVPVMPQMPNGLGTSIMSALGGPAAMAMAEGKGLGEYIDIKKKAEAYEELKDELRKLKDENHNLITKNRDLESKISIAEAQKNLELLTEKLNKKSFLDSEAGQKLLEQVPQILSVMSSNGNAASQQGLAMPQVSEAKQRLIEYISNPDFEEGSVLTLEQWIVTINSYPEVANQINTLIQNNYPTDGNSTG